MLQHSSGVNEKFRGLRDHPVGTILWDNPPLIVFIAHELLMLDRDRIAPVIYPICCWLEKKHSMLRKVSPEDLDTLWKHLFSTLKAIPSCEQKPNKTNGGNDWYFDPNTSVSGMLVNILMTDPCRNDFRDGGGFAEAWRSRIDILLSLSDNCRLFVLAVIATRLDWFHRIDPDWTTKRIFPILESDSEASEALWEGLAKPGAIRRPSFAKAIKPFMFKMNFSKGSAQFRGAMASIRLSAWRTKEEKSSKRLYTDAELREFLTKSDDDSRRQILCHLYPNRSREPEDGWLDELHYFFRQVWPYQTRANGLEVSSTILSIAFSDEEAFSVLADVLISKIHKVKRLPRLNTVREKIIEQNPKKTLKLLAAVLPDAVRDWPYDTMAYLIKVEEADPKMKLNPNMVKLRRKWYKYLETWE